MSNPYGQVVNTEHSSGYGIHAMWVLLLRENEKMWKGDRFEKVLVDGQITTAMRHAFPARDTMPAFRQVVKMRGRYNRGVFTGGRRPIVQSVRYHRFTNGIVIKVTARGRPFDEFLALAKRIKSGEPISERDLV